MKRENCINRNITIASAIISGVNILTFYNAFYKCFKFKYVDDFISLLCLLFSLMILINIKQHIRTIEFCLWYSILFIILLCRINIEYYGAAEPPVRCGESHLSGLTEPLRSL